MTAVVAVRRVKFVYQNNLRNVLVCLMYDYMSKVQ